MHFVEQSGDLFAKLTVPKMGAYDASKIPVKNAPDGSVQVGHWLLQRIDGALIGKMPASLVPYYDIPVRFTRVTSARFVQAPMRTRADAPTPRWVVDLGSPVFGGLTTDVHRHQLVVGSLNGIVTSLDLKTGKRLWAVKAGSQIRSKPTVVGLAVYIATESAVLKLRADSGRRLWVSHLRNSRHSLNPDDPKFPVYSSAVAVEGSTVYVGSRDGCVHALKTTDGSEKRSYCTGDSITATPIITNGNLYFGSFDGKVYALRTNGSLLWTHDMHGPVTTDIALHDAKIFAGSRTYDFSALNSLSGQPFWTKYFWFSWVESTPAFSGETAYIGSSDNCRVRALDSRSGAELWSTLLPGWAWPKPAIGQQTIYVGVIGTTAPYLALRSGGLAALDLRTGELKWFLRSSSSKPVNDLFGFAAGPAVAKRMVYAADLGGRVFAFNDS